MPVAPPSGPRRFAIVVRVILALTAGAVAARADSTNAPAGSESTLPAPLSLADARRLAFERNWDLLAARSDVDLAIAQRIMAREFPNPSLSLGTTLVNVDGHPSGTDAGNGFWDRNYDTVFAVNQLLEIGGKRKSRQLSAAAGIRGAEARLADARRLLELGVANAYVAALQAEADAAILKSSAASLRTEASIAEVRFKAGEIAESDKKQIEIAADRLELDARSAEANARTARINLEVLLGVKHPQGEWAPADSLEKLAGSPAPMDRLEPAAPRPDLLAAEAAKAKADAELRLQKGFRVPDPTVQFQYEHNPPDYPNSLGFSVSLPLPLWNHNRGAIAGARAAQEQAAVLIEKVRAQIAAEIVNARIRYDEAAARLQRYQDEIRPKSKTITETIAFAYNKGGASLVDLLTAERSDNDVRLATAQAEADTASAAAAVTAALGFEATLTSKETRSP